MSHRNGKLWGNIENAGIEIRSVTKDDLEEALDILHLSFFMFESVCIACEINLKENVAARRELRELCRQTADDGVSLIAVDTITDKIVGVSFNKIQYLPDSPNEEPFFVKFFNEDVHSPQSKCLMNFMIEVDSKFDVFKAFGISSICELMFLSILPEWRGQRIGYALSQWTVEITKQLSLGNVKGIEMPENLKNKPPKGVMALFTSIYSQKIGRNLGFQLLHDVSYNNFNFNGKTFDQRIDPKHKTCEHVAIIF